MFISDIGNEENEQIEHTKMLTEKESHGVASVRPLPSLLVGKGIYDGRVDQSTEEKISLLGDGLGGEVANDLRWSWKDEDVLVWSKNGAADIIEGED